MSASPFAIRRATPADAPIITAHRRAMFKDMRVGKSADLDAMDAQFGPWVADALAREIYLGWFITTAQGAIIAGAGMTIDDFPATPRDQTGRRVYVMNVYTDPQYRQRGLARRLMQTILDWCRVNGIHSVALQASDAGRPFYESLGFKTTNEMRLQL
ncbi:MAG: GNAT family N-acetyltransferase [Anaerolineales bacterium]|nr:GNAT family N-acetyltransferase [Anaerolineales bacterium]